MRACLATYEDRLATLIERAGAFQFYALGSSSPVFEGFTPHPAGGAVGLAALLLGFKTDILVCGAISPAYADCVKADGIEVFPWICGPVAAVLRGLVQGDLSRLAMPGGHPRSGRRLRLILAREEARLGQAPSGSQPRHRDGSNPCSARSCS